MRASSGSALCCQVVFSVLAMWPIRISSAESQDPKVEWLVYRSAGLMRGRPGPGEDEGTLSRRRDAVWGGAVYAASLEGDRAGVVRLSPPDKSVSGMSVAANGRMVWVVGGSRGDSTLRTLSYPDLKSREHPRAVPPYQSGWILLSPDGASLAYPVAKERVTDIHCENLDTGEIRALPGEWTWVTFPAWSPDGKKIAFYALKETQGQVLTGVRVFVVDVLSGENRTLTGPFAAVGWPGRSVTIQWPIVWSKASDAVFFHARYGNDPELGRTYRVGLAEIDRPIPISEYACLGTSVRPDTVYVGVHCGIGPVYALSLGTEPPKKTELARGEICYPTISPSETLLAYDDAHSGLVVRRLRAASKPILVTKDFDHSSLFRWVAGPPPPKTFEDPR